MRSSLVAIVGALSVALGAGCTSMSRHSATASSSTAPAGVTTSSVAVTTTSSVTTSSVTTSSVTTSSTSAAPSQAGAVTPGPCALRGAPPATYDHVVWIWMENHSFSSVINSPSAPYETQLARRCGLATAYDGIAHPSLPNYIAAVAGSTFGITDDGPPAAHPLDAPSIFDQVTQAGLQWKAYAESMAAPCFLESAGRYAVRHNPATYFTKLRSDCRTRDVPLGSSTAGALRHDIDAGTLPAFAFITPDVCSDTHDCAVRTGDSWLEGWLTAITSAPSYRDGRTAIIVTWDEGEGGGNHVPTIVVAPSVPLGTTVAEPFDHYSLLRTTEELLGLPGRLGAAGTATSMRDPFHL